MTSQVMPSWAKELGLGPIVTIKSFLPIYIPKSSLPDDIRSYFSSNPGKEAVYKTRSFADMPMLEFATRINPDLYAVAYMAPLGEIFHIFLNIEEIIRPMLDQIAHFNLAEWKYEFHIPAEARQKCPLLCKLISNMDKDLLGVPTLFQFAGITRGMQLVYSDLADFYDSLHEAYVVIRRLFNICDKLGNEIVTAGMLDITANRKVRDLLRVIRLICLNL